MTKQLTSSAPAPAAQAADASSSIKKTNMAEYYEKQFASDIENFKNGGRVKSGYANLDSFTNLYPGLYVIGAISSLGKTTFIHQIGEQIAQSGTHVLFFSLEQSILELASKSIARAIAQEDEKNALSSLQVRRGDLSNSKIAAAIDKSKKYSDKITIVECSFRATIDDITSTVEEYIKQNNTKPVVIIDYLQVIQPPLESHMTTKDLVDYHVRRLKELQTDNKLTLIVISSLNRQNYMTAIDFESFKESGGIEYTADVLWGLQLQCIHKEIFDKQGNINKKRGIIVKAKKDIPRKIELICLKNRFGVSSYICHFDYYPKSDWFKPDLTNLKLDNIDDVDTDGFMKIPEGYEPEIPFND